MSDRRAFIEIDLTAIATSHELHQVLSRSLGFPDWYGHNWAAFWDAITGLVEMPLRLRLRGWASLASRLPDDARIMRSCLDGMETQYPAWAAEVEYV